MIFTPIKDIVDLVRDIIPSSKSAPASVLPRKGTTGAALAIVMIIMSFLACLAVWATVSITVATSKWTASVTNTITVQIKPPSIGPVQPETVTSALEIIRGTPGIAHAEPLSTAENARLLEPWLGSNALGGEIPLPVLIPVTLKRGQNVDIAALRAKFADEIPTASVDDHSRWTDRLVAVSRSLTTMSLAVLTLVLVAATAIIMFATHAGLMTHRAIVEILHLSGAQADFISAEFERHFRRLGLRCGGAGLALALLTVIGLYLGTGTETNADGIPLVPRLAITPMAFLALFSVPIGAGLIATWTARMTVLKALAAMP